MANVDRLMSNHQQLFRTLFSNSIGMDRVFNRLTSTETSNFPPYNIIRHEDRVSVELAVAGYKKENISVTVNDGVLSITGSWEQEDKNHLHKGISTKDFKRTFSLGEYVEVKSAELKDGLLRVSLEEVLPPEKQLKEIKIK
tara:strand:+ start:99 stop:521 length:423 start_codon:yes stop_codon:yes gene_type:complete